VDEAGTGFQNAAGEAVQLLPPLGMVLLPCVEVKECRKLSLKA
jgi:hypothetical protein